MMTVSQAEKLLELEHVCWPLFTILLFENFRHRGQPFTLPTGKLNTVKGLSPSKPAPGPGPIGGVRPDLGRRGTRPSRR